MMMINFETQSKQLTLLQEYVAALERETQARQMQSQEMQRAIEQSIQNERNTYEAFTRVQKQNDFLRYVLSQLNHQHRDFQGLKMDFEILHETMGREHFEKLELYSQIKDVQNHHSMATEENKKLSEEIQRITLMLQHERQRWRQEKKLHKQKEQQQNMTIASKNEEINHLALRMYERQHSNENLQSQLQHMQQKMWSLEQSNRELSIKIEELNTQMKVKSDFYEKIIIEKCSQLQKNKNKIEELVRQLQVMGQKNQTQRKELNDIKEQLILAELQLTRLREYNSKMNTQFPLLAEKNEHIAKLERKYQQTVRKLEELEQQIRKMQQEHQMHIEDIQSKNHENLRAMNIELSEIQEANRILKAQIQVQQRNVKQNIKDSTKIQEELRKKIAEQEAELEAKQQRIRDIKMTLELQKLYSQKNVSASLAVQNIQIQQSQIFSQKTTIDRLTLRLNEKQQEVQTLEQSNGSLRRLMMTAIANEQKALQELQKIRKKNSNTSSKLQIRTRIHYDSSQSLRESIVLEKGMRASKSHATIEKAGKILFKKRATPSQYQFTENGQSVRQVSR